MRFPWTSMKLLRADIFKTSVTEKTIKVVWVENYRETESNLKEKIEFL